MNSLRTARPLVGMTMKTARLGVVTILKVHPFGTVDVQASSGKCYRLTGYNWL